MSRTRTQQVREIFETALAMPSDRRVAFLDAAAPPGSSMRREVDLLLRLDRSMGDLIDSLSGDPHTPLAPGSVIADRYELQETLGQGGFGIVYAARQTHPVIRDVAVKIARHALLTRSARDRFSAERQALAVMQHPGIAQVFDAGALPDGRPFLAMERVYGQPITAVASDLPLSAKINLITEIADAIQHAHQKGVVHRDLKPSNILAYRDGDRLRCKVIDFGTVRTLGIAHADVPRVSDGPSILGTPRYMAPEQCSADAPEIDTRADQYALAVVATELLFPRDADRLLATPPALWPAPPEVPDLAFVLCKARAADPDARYASVSEFAADLSSALARLPVHARPWTRSYLASRFIARNRLAAAILTTAACICLIALIAVSTALTREQEARAAANREKNIAQSRAAEAVAANTRAELEKTIALEQSYAAAISAAAAAAANDDASTAQLWLARAPESLRNWEWRLVATRADSSLASFSDGSGPVVAAARATTNSALAWVTSRGVLCLQSGPRRQRLDSLTDTRDLCFSADAAHLFVVRKDTVTPVHVEDGACETPWKLPGAATVRLLGSELVVGRDNAPAVLLDPSSTQVLRTFGTNADPSTLLEVSSDGRFIACASTSGSLSVFDARRAVRLMHRQLPSHISSLSLSPDGSRLAIAHADGTALLIDPVSGEILSRLARDTRLLRFSHDGAALLCSSDSGAILLIDPRSGDRINVALGHTDRITSLSISPSEGVLISGSADGSVRLWDLLSLSRHLPASAAPGSTVATHTGGDSVCVLRESCVDLIDPSGVTLTRDVDLPAIPLSRAVTTLGRSIIVAERDAPRLHALHLADRTWPLFAEYVGEAARTLTGSPCGRYLAIESQDCTTRLLSGTTTPTQLWERAGVEVWSFSPDGSRVVLATADRHIIEVLDSESGRSLRRYTLPPDATLEHALMLARDRIAISVSDGRVLLLSSDAAEPLATGSPGFGHLIIAGQTLDDQRLIVLSSSSILSFDARTLRLVAAVPTRMQAAGGVLSADSRRLTAWTHSGAVWQTAVPDTHWTPAFLSQH